VNVESLGPVSSLAGTQLAEARLADAIRAHAAESGRKAGASSRSADDTPGVQQMSGGEEIGDGDSNARMFWDLPNPHRQGTNPDTAKPENASDDIGRHVDLSG
jgi:hypothetical protein